MKNVYAVKYKMNVPKTHTGQLNVDPRELPKMLEFGHDNLPYDISYGLNSTFYAGLYAACSNKVNLSSISEPLKFLFSYIHFKMEFHTSGTSGMKIGFC